MTRKLLITVVSLLLFASISSAQSSSGQLCIRAFEDRNANGSQDANEPPIVRGVSATLADATGLIVDSALMENSSTASSGTLCFQRLEAGQYTMRVSSADYTPTTPSDFTAAVSDSGIPQVLSYGGQFIPVEMPTTEGEISQAERLQSTLIRSVFAGLGALLIMGAMTVLGALIYFFVLRNRQSPPATGVYQAVPPTGQYATVPDTGQYPAVAHTPPTGVAPISDDTDMPDVVTVEDMYDMYSDDDDDNDTSRPVERFTDPYDNVSDDDFEFDDDEDSAYKPPSE